VIWGEDGDNNKTKNRKTDEGFVQGVVASLQYVRDRVGVPRDMTLPAARQLRAVLNWAIDALQKQ
jgi:glutathione S-transferase